MIGWTLAFVVWTAAAAPAPDATAPVIDAFLRWAVEGNEMTAEPPHPSPALPHRSCGGRLDPEHLPPTIYVTWGLSAEAQHAACNWKYDVASHHASPLTADEAAETGRRIVAGEIGPHERAFFHAIPRGGGRFAVTAGYCWGAATGTFEIRGGTAVLIGDLAIHGY